MKKQNEEIIEPSDIEENYDEALVRDVFFFWHSNTPNLPVHFEAWRRGFYPNNPPLNASAQQTAQDSICEKNNTKHNIKMNNKNKIKNENNNKKNKLRRTQILQTLNHQMMMSGRHYTETKLFMGELIM